MTRHIGLIIFLLFLVWQIVSAIINHVNATKQQERAAELAKRRRESGENNADSNQKRSRIDDLAARRKAQLEELRRRRDAARSGNVQTRTGVATPSGGTSAGPALRVPREIQIEKPNRAPQKDPWQARQEAIRREREAQQRKTSERVRDAQKRETRARAINQREQAEKRQRKVQREAESVIAAAASAPDVPTAVEADEVRHRVHDAKELRRLFILKELIDPPLAMREPLQ